MSTSITDTPLLESDFYRFQEGLTHARERESLGQLRAYLEAEVRPIADQYWARAEFPMQTIAPLAELGMYGPGIPLVRHFENSASSTAAGRRSSSVASTPASRRSSGCSPVSR